MNIRLPSMASPTPTAAQPALCGADSWNRRSVEEPLEVVDKAKPSCEVGSWNWTWPTAAEEGKGRLAKARARAVLRRRNIA